MNKIALLIIASITLTLTGCASTPRAVPGGTPATEIQEVIYRPIRTPHAARASLNVALTWPVRGTVISSFGDRASDFRNKGIDIRAAEGKTVRAAAGGRVVYCDAKMRGLGKTIIIDHAGDFQTVYSYNADILVTVGDTVKTGDAIARVGRSGRATESCLHFELRRDGEPINPLAYLR